MQLLFDEIASGLVPPHRQSPVQSLTSVNPSLHAAPSPVMPQQARWPALPHGAAWAVTQCPLELMLVGFAEPPHRQFPLQPVVSTSPEPHELPSINSPVQQAR